MTNAGGADEWWKQYGGEGVSSDPTPAGSPPQYPSAEPSSYPSAPAAPQYPSAPQYSSTPVESAVPQPNSQYPSTPPQPQYAGYQSPAQPAVGYPPGYQPYGYPNSRGTNGLAIASLITSMLGFASCGATSVVGIILGVIALNQIKQSGQEGRVLAVVGICAGVAIPVLWVLYFIILALLS
ncbi:DUF4190 domain-containing protein [Nocardia paucivorans]|uniref:DUF4190 domain-containing protein n=1 Tax=Nocardia paucivorans TaxID=114259 RepID=UPI0002D4E103|nr:DUF4190 domain-containing protein [Nocardia paucivorans]